MKKAAHPAKSSGLRHHFVRPSGSHPVPFGQTTKPDRERTRPKMSNDESGTPTPTKREIRRSLDAWHITTTPPTADDWAFLAREFILCTLPHRNPGDVPAWSRKNGIGVTH